MQKITLRYCKVGMFTLLPPTRSVTSREYLVQQLVPVDLICQMMPSFACYGIFFYTNVGKFVLYIFFLFSTVRIPLYSFYRREDNNNVVSDNIYV